MLWVGPAVNILINIVLLQHPSKTVWPSGVRRWLQAPIRKGVGSNPTAVIFTTGWAQEFAAFAQRRHAEAHVV